MIVLIVGLAVTALAQPNNDGDKKDVPDKSGKPPIVITNDKKDDGKKPKENDQDKKGKKPEAFLFSSVGRMDD